MNENQTILDYEEGSINPETNLAGKGKRLANHIIDRFVFNFIILTYIVTMGDTIIAEAELFGFGFFLILVFWFGYWILSEYYFGKTLGKLITKTKVVTMYGERPSFLQIVGRTLCRLIPFEPFSFFGSRPIGWHDSLSNTRVVNDEIHQKRETDYV